MNGDNMKKAKKSVRAAQDRDTMRAEYDFSTAVRGLTAQRYAQGANVVVIDPDVAEYFPDHDSVNESLRSLVAIMEKAKKSEPRVRR